ncbi:hypothetical protein ACFPT7_02725 [Acidicapsa dinghuensis]|uniref:Ribbon-helix-helix protein, CopG family n=1 Tax=Acidicapsa dinghuensis TaxID=2218256 RepID=A0ABW1EAB5_9BACT
MPRNAAITRSHDDSFADTLESVYSPSTGVATTNRENTDAATDSRWNQEALRTAVRKLQSQAAPNKDAVISSSRASRQGRDQQPSEGTLSYERALRLLARVDLHAYDDLELTPARLPANPDLPYAQSDKSNIKNRHSSKADFRSNRDENRPGFQAGNSPLKRSKSQGAETPSADLPKKPERGNARIRKTTRTTGHSKKSPHPPRAKAVANEDSLISEVSITVSPRKAATTSAKVRKAVPIEAENLTAIAKSGLTQQRRTIVSLRLTDEEMEQLRLRAEESGINVSAYVRSCVMEAENLRSQVRHVMAEIRALGAASLMQRHALPLTPQEPASTRKSWLQALKSAATRFGLIPFTLFRRTA